MNLLFFTGIYAVALWVAMLIMNIKGQVWKVLIIALISTVLILLPGRAGYTLSTIAGIALISGLTDAEIKDAFIAGLIASGISFFVIINLVLS